MSNSRFTQNILERTNEIGQPIRHPSISLFNPPYANKVQPLHDLLNDILKSGFLQKDSSYFQT